MSQAAAGVHSLSEEPEPGVDFRGGRLSVNTNETRQMDDIDIVSAEGGVNGDGGGLRRDRPFSASMASRRSTASTKSRISLSPHVVTSDFAANNLFCHRTNAIEKAVEACKKSVVQPDVDGEVTGYWLLTEIDHWDMEKERIVLLTTKSLLVVKYDFIALTARQCTRLLLNIVHYVEIGDFVYPQYSFMPPRQHGGFRIHWAQAQASFSQRWNPLCPDIGYLTLTHHLLAYNANEKETVTFDVADLADSVIQAVTLARQAEGRNEPLTVEQRPIVIESYASLPSLVFNQSHLGFHMERGGVSF